MQAANASAPPDMGRPQFESHKVVEPIIVIGIMIGSLYINRDRTMSIFGSSRSATSTRLRSDQYAYDVLEQGRAAELEDPKENRACGLTVRTPDSSRWAGHVHSRIVQKFPFFVEMFYWVVNLGFYALTKTIAETMGSVDESVVDVARRHGEAVLQLEHESVLRFLYPILEVDYQHFFLNHPSLITFCNRMYSLVHIPASMLFLSWYYSAAPNHRTFAVARRTMTLSNFFSFAIFSFFPCIPPRLLPANAGFFDTVRQGHAESIWVGSKSVNQFAAMPSLHFAYSFCIGCTLVYHSGFLQRIVGTSSWADRWAAFGAPKLRRSRVKEAALVIIGICYPLLVLNIIVATANHYWMDATVSAFVVAFSWFVNPVLNLLLPFEYCFCWVFRIAKPVPTTGWRDVLFGFRG